MSFVDEIFKKYKKTILDSDIDDINNGNIYDVGQFYIIEFKNQGKLKNKLKELQEQYLNIGLDPEKDIIFEQNIPLI